MKSLTVKSIPDPLYRRLKRAATANHRSLNGEILFQLESTLTPPRRNPETLLRWLDAQPWRQRVTPLTEATMKQALREGRR